MIHLLLYFNALKRETIERGLVIMNAKQHVKPHFIEALILTLFFIALISYSIMKLGSVPHIPILIAIIVLFMYGVMRKVPYRVMEQSMITSVSTSIGAIYIFLLIGVLISSWLISGTIPTLLYIGLSIVSASFFTRLCSLLQALSVP